MFRFIFLAIGIALMSQQLDLQSFLGLVILVFTLINYPVDNSLES